MFFTEQDGEIVKRDTLQVQHTCNTLLVMKPIMNLDAGAVSIVTEVFSLDYERGPNAKADRDPQNVSFSHGRGKSKKCSSCPVSSYLSEAAVTKRLAVLQLLWKKKQPNQDLCVQSRKFLPSL